MDCMNQFVKQGYVVITKGIHPASAARLAKKLRGDKGWKSIFLSGGAMDPNRLQCVAPKDIHQELDQCFRKYWKAFFPNSEARDWVGLRSKAGGVKQSPHTDFTFPLRYPHLDHANMPAGIIIALEPGTHLLVYGWNKLYPSEQEEEVVYLNIGDAIIFRGDLIHAGGAYTTDNVRVHAYLDVVGVKRKHNQTNIFPFLTFDTSAPRMCPLHNCNELGTEATIQRHVNRYHRARCKKKLQINKQQVSTKEKASTNQQAKKKKRRLIVESDDSDSSETLEIVDLLDSSESSTY